MYALVDCNNFYVSCERVFAPRLQEQPVVVLSNNDGCLISRSDEAKALGFKMGVPYHLARPLLEQHGVQVCSSNYALYGDMSRRVVQVLSGFTPGVEVYSIDEAFLDLAGMDWIEKDLRAYGARVHATVRQATGIPTSVGVAPTKTLAKLANRLAGRSGPAECRVRVLATPEQCRQALAATPIKDVWGIGRRYTRQLLADNITTAADLAAMPESWVRRRLGGVVGARLWRELHGHPCLEWNPAEAEDDEEQPPVAAHRHSATCTRSFGRPQHQPAVLAEALASFAATAAAKLRRQGLAAHLVTVILGTDRYAPTAGPTTHTTVISLGTATNDTTLLTQAALRGLRQLHRAGVAYYRAGVLLSGLEPAGQAQLGLFAGSAAEQQRSRQLMAALDKVNARFGRQTVQLAAAGVVNAAPGQLPQPAWAGRCNFRSPAYTTDWNELWVLK
jgi:DNA polymerase V